MLQQMRLADLLRWYRHYQDEPWGFEIEDDRHAELCALLANGLYQPREPFHSADFSYRARFSAPKQQTVEDQLKVMDGFLARFGA